MKIRPKRMLQLFLLSTVLISILILAKVATRHACSYSQFPAIGNETQYLTDSGQELEDKNTWTRISDELFVYSAYLDDRLENPVIRVVGLWRIPRARLRQNPLQWPSLKDEAYFGTEFRGRVFYEDITKGGRLMNTSCSMFTRQIFEEGLKIYGGVFIKCGTEAPLSKNISSRHIAIYPKEVTSYPTKLVPIHSGSTSSTFLSICVRPLFGPFDNLHKLAQFIAYYEVVGVTRFTFYELSVSPRIRRYLMMLASANAGIQVHLHDWNLPTGSWAELWDYGSLAALNDCLLRSIGSSKYMLVADLDEFIVPQVDGWIVEVMQRIEEEGAYSQYLIRNTFFCSEFCEGGSGMESMDGLDIFDNHNCHLRTRRVWPAEARSKYIVRPERVEQLGHHWVTKFFNAGLDRRKTSKSNHTYEFSPNDLMMNHYRSCIPISSKRQPILNETRVFDDRIIRFKERMEDTTSFRLYLSTK